MITLTVTLHDERTDLAIHDSLVPNAGTAAELAIGPVTLTAAHLRRDPPSPTELSNAIGLLGDELDDFQRSGGPLATVPDAVIFRGAAATAFASVELGAPLTSPLTLTRDAAEDVFRTVATEALEDRRHNPGLAESEVQSIVGTGCIVVSIMRRLGLSSIVVEPT